MFYPKPCSVLNEITHEGIKYYIHIMDTIKVVLKYDHMK